MAFERKYMERAIALAKKGTGHVNPNPLVGAVIVKNGTIIGEGYHARYGDLHAERSALKSLENQEDARGAELYVTLEPCCHHGKQPPCTEAILAAGIHRVYVGSDDPNPLVAGKGIWQLRQAGVEVVTHCMKAECDALNPVFFHFITTGRPYVMYKFAMTMDGKTCTRTGKSQWISNETSRKRVMSFRNEFTGIMTGIGTVLADDPLLTCRMEGGRNPVRIICDSRFRIPMQSQIVQTADRIPTIVAYREDFNRENNKKLKELQRRHVETLPVPAENGDLNLNRLMELLGKRKIDGILLEGGGRLAWSMFADQLVDEVRLFVGPKIFGGASAGTPVTGRGIDDVDGAALFHLDRLENLEGDIFATYHRILPEDGTEEGEVS